MIRVEKRVFLLGTVGSLSLEEERLARSVFGDRLPYGRIWIGKSYLKGANAPVTIATSPRKGAAEYVICWGDPGVYADGAEHVEHTRATLIHELTHVWQGHHGFSAMSYMLASVVAQVSHGVKDIIKKRRYRTWDIHRAQTYLYRMSDIGKPWSHFNVEQQARIVEDWCRATGYTNSAGTFIDGGQMSADDRRYPYIVHNIRAGDK